MADFTRVGRADVQRLHRIIEYVDRQSIYVGLAFQLFFIICAMGYAICAGTRGMGMR